MFERYTDRARRVIILAQEEARMLNHNYIGTEHLLLGLIHEGEGVAAKALEILGISLPVVRRHVEEIVRRGVPRKPVPYTPRATKVFELALREMLQLGHNYIGTEHLLLGLIREGEGVAAQVLVKLGADLNRVRQQVIQLLSGYQGTGPPKSDVSVPSALPECLTDLNILVSFEMVPPLIGRDKDVERTMLALLRPSKNSPLLVGEPGVGKTALGLGLAKRAVSGMLPQALQGLRLVALDARALLASLPANTGVGEWSHLVFDWLDLSEAVVVIDDLHAVPPPFAIGLLQRLTVASGRRVIGATTPPGRQLLAEQWPAFDRQMQVIELAEPSQEQTARILTGLREHYAATQSVRITDAAFAAASRLAQRSISRARPGCAVDLIEEAIGLHELRRTTPPPGIQKINEAIAEARRIKESHIDAQDFEAAARMRDREKQLLTQREAAQSAWFQQVTEAGVGEDLVTELVGATGADKPRAAVEVPSRATPPAETTWVPVRAESTAILLGASTFADPRLGDIPAVSRNLLDLHRAFTSTGGLFEPSRVRLFDQVDPGDLEQIDELAQSATDTLLVYYSGHGLNEFDDLYLAYARTNSAKARLTALSYSSLRHIVTGSPARRCIVILDCCFSGKAIGWMSNEDAAPTGEIDIQGTYLLTATADNQKALAPEGERNSAFTGALLRLIREGIDSSREFIRIGDIHPYLVSDLRSRNLPLPRQRPVDSIGALAFSRNPRWPGVAA